MTYVFLSYINRSGSTFLVNQFSKLNIFCVCPEADILYDLLLRNPNRKRSFKSRNIHQLLKDKKFILWKLAPEKVEKILLSKITHGEKFLKILCLFRETHSPHSIYILFKYNFIIRLKSFFEKKCSSDTFQWIYLCRNPLSVYASQKQAKSPTTLKTMAINIFVFCRKVRLLESACARIGTENYIKIHYEDLIINFNPSYRNLLGFLGANNKSVRYISTPGKLRSFMTEEYNSLHPNIDSPPDTLRLNAWRHDLSEYEKYYIHQKLKAQIPAVNEQSEFRMKFTYMFIRDRIISYFIIAKIGIQVILNRK